MAKRKKKAQGNLFGLLIPIFAIVAIVMMFVTAIKVEDTSYSGLNVIFGHSVGEGISVEVFQFSFMNLLSYLLILGVFILSILSVAKGGNLIGFLLLIISIVAGVFLLLTKQFIVVGEFFDGLLSIGNTSFAEIESVKLGAGPIVGAIMMFLSAICAILKIALGKK